MQVPFAIGDEVEEKTHNNGFRGAWFRAKIQSIQFRDNQPCLQLKYLDYDDETTISLYQHPPGVPSSSTGWKDMMVRPRYPERGARGKDVLVSTRHWRVGDLADWLWQNAYWSGRITEIKGPRAKFVCLDPPNGEGGRYTVPVEELRPTVYWSLQHGWQVPVNTPAKLVPSAKRNLRKDYDDEEVKRAMDEDCRGALKLWDDLFLQLTKPCICDAAPCSCDNTETEGA